MMNTWRTIILFSPSLCVFESFQNKEFKKCGGRPKKEESLKLVISKVHNRLTQMQKGNLQ